MASTGSKKEAKKAIQDQTKLANLDGQLINALNDGDGNFYTSSQSNIQNVPFSVRKFSVPKKDTAHIVPMPISYEQRNNDLFNNASIPLTTCTNNTLQATN